MAIRYIRCLRHPRTTQEHRMNCVHPELVRAKRVGKNLPTAFDDILRNDINDKNWKRCKVRKQWM